MGNETPSLHYSQSIASILLQLTVKTESPLKNCARPVSVSIVTKFVTPISFPLAKTFSTLYFGGIVSNKSQNVLLLLLLSLWLQFRLLPMGKASFQRDFLIYQVHYNILESLYSV